MTAIPRLIFFDGLPGSGKTTTTQQFWLHLEALGYPARWWFEHQLGHPVFDYEALREARQAGREPLRAMLGAAHERWAALVRQIEVGRETTLIESTLGQTTVGTQLLADESRDEILAHFDRTAEIIAPLDPVLIQLHQPDVAAALYSIGARRGAWFAEYLQGEFAGSARGQRLGRSDLAAVVEYFQERQALSAEAFARFPGRKLVYDNSDCDWARQGRAIADFLGLPPPTPPACPANAPEYVGRYRAESGDEWLVEADAAGLHLAGDSPARLLPHGRDRFVIQSLCVETVFERGATGGAVVAIACEANLPGMPTRWERV